MSGPRGGVFLGGFLQIFFGGGVPPNFRGGVFFWGGFLQIFFGGGSSKLFFGGTGGGSPPEYGQRSAGTHPTGMHSCLFCFGLLPWCDVV